MARTAFVAGLLLACMAVGALATADKKGYYSEETYPASYTYGKLPGKGKTTYTESPFPSCPGSPKNQAPIAGVRVCSKDGYIVGVAYINQAEEITALCNAPMEDTEDVTCQNQEIFPYTLVRTQVWKSAAEKKSPAMITAIVFHIQDPASGEMYAIPFGDEESLWCMDGEYKCSMSNTYIKQLKSDKLTCAAQGFIVGGSCNKDGDLVNLKTCGKCQKTPKATYTEYTGEGEYVMPKGDYTKDPKYNKDPKYTKDPKGDYTKDPKYNKDTVVGDAVATRG